jgi:hypothetical protein
VLEFEASTSMNYFVRAPDWIKRRKEKAALSESSNCDAGKDEEEFIVHQFSVQFLSLREIYLYITKALKWNAQKSCTSTRRRSILPHPLLSGLGFQSLYSSSEVRYRLLNLSTDFVQIFSIDLLLIVPSISRLTFLYYYTFLNSYMRN